MSMSHRMSRRSAINEAQSFACHAELVEASLTVSAPATAQKYSEILRQAQDDNRGRGVGFCLSNFHRPPKFRHAGSDFRQNCAREDRADFWRPGPGLGAHPPRLEGFFVHRA